VPDDRSPERRMPIMLSILAFLTVLSGSLADHSLSVLRLVNAFVTALVPLVPLIAIKKNLAGCGQYATGPQAIIMSGSQLTSTR
jgi:hypothetical protein